MRALVVTAPGKGGSAAVTELPDPRPEPDEVAVRVTSCGLCGTDMHLLGGELPAAVYPLVPGHELTGEIVAVGAAVTGRAVGDRVAVDPNMPCGACHYCRIGRTDEARTVLTRLRGDAGTPGEELAEIERAECTERAQSEPLTLRRLLSPRLRPVFVVGILLVLFQNFVGINTIIYYAPTLLTDIGFGSGGAILANVGIGLLNMLMTLPAMRLIDRRGRKPLLRWGALGMCAAMVLLAVTNLSGLGYGVLLSVLTLGGIALYIASFAISWGPVQWVMLPELFPMRIRASAVGLCVLFNWLFNMIVALVFPSLLHAWGAGINFLFFAGTTLLAFLFVQRLLPETKGRSLEEIEQDLLRGRPARPEADGSVPVSSGAAHP